jgi:hypothetical protein
LNDGDDDYDDDDDDKNNIFISGSLNESASSSSGYTVPSVKERAVDRLKVVWTEDSHENLARRVGILADI